MAVRKKSSTSAASTTPKSSKRSTTGRKKKTSHTSSGEPSPAKFGSLDRYVLEHIGRYRISIRPVIAKLFFQNEESRVSDVVRRLQADGRLTIAKRLLPKNYSYYQLTKKGCLDMGVPIDRARRLSSLGLARSLGVLWFATMNGSRRARLKDDALPKGFPSVPGRPAHVGEQLTESTARLYRVHVVAEETDHTYSFGEIHKAIREIALTPQGQALINGGVYGFALLVNEEEKKNRFLEALHIARESFPAGAVVVVETAPSPSNLPLFVNGLIDGD